MTGLLVARVEAVESLGAWVICATLHVESTPRFRFEPGQYVSLHSIEDGAERVRHYSIASPPRPDSRIELCLTRPEDMPEIPGTSPLAPGDVLRLSGPHGTFRLRRPVDRDCLFVATGTGLSPLRPMLHQALDAGPAEGTHPLVSLLHGARARDDLLFRSEFEALATSRARFRYFPTLSRPRAEWTGLSGHVQAHLDRVLGGSTDVDVYVCGNRAMITAVVSELAVRGVHADRVHYERYA